MKLAITPQDAWQPLPAKEWNEDAARHFLRRAGWAAQPAEVERLMKEGLPAALERLFPVKAAPLPKPRLVANIERDTPDYVRKIRAAENPEQKRLIQREQRERQEQAIQDLSIKWLQFASLPDNSVAEKWVLFLGDIYVISQEKVRNTAWVYAFQDTLRQLGFGRAPDLAKAVSRTPAMMQYLDLQDNKIGTPNENFARELFELFLLGEGNYTEQDIKESARAFTGYRERLGEFHLIPNQHDNGPKTIFGKTGAFTGDDVIDLAFTQPAAGRFLPHEMVKFYLVDEGIPAEYLAVIGDWWRDTGYDMRQLALKFFGSRLFFDPSFRGTYIKSPIQFYLGLEQDLNLDVAPFTRHALNALRLMGENPFRPPNVRGWVGGRLWINSGTLNSRRQLVETLFTPINEDNLNADEQVQLVAARSAGLCNFTVTDERLEAMLAGMTPAQITDRFVDYFLTVRVDDGFRANVLAFLSDPAAEKNRLARLRSTVVTLLQSPEYQLC